MVLSHFDLVDFNKMYKVSENPWENYLIFKLKILYPVSLKGVTFLASIIGFLDFDF